MKHYSYQDLADAIEAIASDPEVNHEFLAASGVAEIAKAISGEGITPWRPIPEIGKVPGDALVVAEFYKDCSWFKLVIPAAMMDRYDGITRFMEIPE